MAHNFGLSSLFRLYALAGARLGGTFEPIRVPVIGPLIALLIVLLVHGHDHAAYCVISCFVRVADTDLATGPHMSYSQLYCIVGCQLHRLFMLIECCTWCHDIIDFGWGESLRCTQIQCVYMLIYLIWPLMIESLLFFLVDLIFKNQARIKDSGRDAQLKLILFDIIIEKFKGLHLWPSLLLNANA